MMQKNFLQVALQELNKRYPADAQYDFLIDKATQETEIENLKKTIKYEQFFFVLNLVARKLEHVNGVAEWLGYHDENFSLFDYFNIIHPSNLTALNLSALSAFDTANSEHFSPRFMQDKVVVQIPLRTAKGHYVLTKRTLYPFQIDQNTGKVLSYLNHYVVLKEYEDFDTLDLRIGRAQKLLTVDEFNAVKLKIQSLLKTQSKPFSFNKKELEILGQIVNRPEITLKEIAENLNLNLDTLRKTTNHRIIGKAKDYFGIIAFESLKEVALYLKKQGVFK